MRPEVSAGDSLMTSVCWNKTGLAYHLSVCMMMWQCVWWCTLSHIWWFDNVAGFAHHLSICMMMWQCDIIKLSRSAHQTMSPQHTIYVTSSYIHVTSSYILCHVITLSRSSYQQNAHTLGFICMRQTRQAQMMDSRQMIDWNLCHIINHTRHIIIHTTDSRQMIHSRSFCPL